MQAAIGDLFEMTNTMPTKTTEQAAASGFDYAAMPTEHVSGARECAAWVRDTLGKLEAHTIETMTVFGAKLEMLTQALREALLPGAREEWEMKESGRADDRQREREQLLSK